MVTTVILVVVFGFVAYYSWKNSPSKKSDSKKQIPGPPTFPIVGSLLSFTGNKAKVPYVLYSELCKQYGSIVRLDIGAMKQIVIQDLELLKEVATSEVWTNNTIYGDWIMKHRAFGKNLGLLFSNGEVHRSMRKFTSKTLRDFGYGKKANIECVSHDQLNELTQSWDTIIGSKENVTICMKQVFGIPVLNTLWIMVIGCGFSKENEKLKKIMEEAEKEMKENPIGSLTSIGFLNITFPILAKCIPDKGLPSQKSAQILIREIITERRSEGVYQHDQRDFIDVFLKTIDNNKHIENTLFTDEQLIVVCLDLFSGGSDTTRNALEFAVLFLMKYPHVQTKLQVEIDRAVGNSRLACLSDKANMPYTEAVILETLRLGSIIPFILKKATQDTTLGDYEIPKGMGVTLNIYGLHMDEKTWGDPNIFRPERFIDSTNSKIINAEKILPFLTGKRVCIAEAHARSTLFLFITTLFQKYTFSISSEHGLPSDDVSPVGFTLGPDTYYSVVTPRHHC